MALIKTKQVQGLDTQLGLKMEQSNLDALSVDSKDTSILALASSSATNLSVDSKDTSILALATAADTAQSVDSKDTSILALADSAAENYVIDESVDSKDTSILALATAADTAQSVDSKDASVLNAANNYTDGELGNYDTTTVVDSKDASILALASSSATNLSVDSKDTSILALATAADTAQSVDSKDTSILALATAADTAQSVDSKDTSILVAAQEYADSTAEQYAIDEFGTGATALAGAPGTLNLTGAGGSIGTLEVVDPLQGQFVLDLSVAIEGANPAEAEQNIIGMYINGLRIEASSINVVSNVAVEIDLPYAIDGNDVFEIKYNKVG